MSNVNGITKKIHFTWIVDKSLNEKEFAAVANGLTRMAEKIKSLTGIDYELRPTKSSFPKVGTTVRSYSFLNGSFNDTSDNEIRINVVNKPVYSRGNYQLFGHQITKRFSDNMNPQRAAVILNLDLIRNHSRNTNDIEKLVYWYGIHEVGHVFGIAGKHEYRIENRTAEDNRGAHCVDTTCNMFAGTGTYDKDANFAIKNSNKNTIHCKWCLSEWKAYPNILEKLGT
jgi:predicted Zn-dependent protease|tara:strand:+ start:1276 stop:1956 length:681 start_codon:yes stop_codon:yes gene_type:complete